MASVSHVSQNMDFNILILGDGDFSFTLAFIQKLRFSNGTQFPFLLYLKHKYNNMDCINVNVISTSFDDKAVLTQKYPHSQIILKKLTSLNQVSNKQIKKEKKIKFESKDVLMNVKITIKHRIDATNLSIFYNDTKSIFDLIIFNHPHLGFEHIHRNASLLMHILLECNNIVNEDGQIWITLLQHQYESWNIETKIGSNGLNMQLSLLSSFIFYDRYYPGYSTKRHQSNKSFRRNRPSQRMGNDNEKQETQSINYIFVRRYSQKHLFLEYVTLMNKSIDKCIESNSTKNGDVNDCNVLCKQCGKVFNEKRSLITHTKSNRCSKQRKHGNAYKCNKCEKCFQSLHDLEQHNIAKHDGINKNIKPDWYQNEEEKIEKHNDDNAQNVVHCRLCDETFQNEIQHKQWITPGILDPMRTQEIAMYQCSLCQKTFTFKRDLLQHVNVCA